AFEIFTWLEFRRVLFRSFKIESYDREGNTFIATRKSALEHMANMAWKRLEQGKTVTAVVRLVERKYAVLDIGGIEVELNAKEFKIGRASGRETVWTTGGR